ncbi:MAG TPA: hypothetical protein VHE55_04670 [Fimbriimonadaceae bacterium]|nr:hypothetical protein [Fimbriimonadaceae bacterium]
MTQDEFMALQYQTLREEIRDTKARIYKLIGLALLIMPAAQYLVGTSHLPVLLLGLPLIILIMALLYVSENHSLMRCGRYIRTHIENKIHGEGWEEWLESKDSCEPRNVDKFVNYCFYGLFFLYYTVAVCLAVQYTADHYSQLATGAIIGAYSAVGVVYAAFLLKAIRLTTSTKLDPPHPHPKSIPAEPGTVLPQAQAVMQTEQQDRVS